MNVGIVVYLPTYYHNVLGMDLTSVSDFSSILCFFFARKGKQK